MAMCSMSLVKEEKLISVIVPVYTAARFLPRCIESISGQTYTNLEIICVDDGSSDNSLDVLNAYAANDSRIIVINKKNAGVAAARNTGLNRAQGDYVTFVDADDWLEVNTYETIIQRFDTEIDLVCIGVHIDGKNHKTNELEEYCNHFADGLQKPMPQYLAEMNASVWNKVYRNRLIKQHNVRYPEGVAYGEDAAFFYCYASMMQGCVCGIKQRLYHYVQNTTSAMANPNIANRLTADLLKSYNHVHSFYAQKGVRSCMMPVLNRLFDGLYQQAHKTGLLKSFSKAMYKAAKASGLLETNHKPHMLALRMSNLSSLERQFHWFDGNRECYGFAGYSIISVTYEKNFWTYRIIGRQIKKEKKEQIT